MEQGSRSSVSRIGVPLSHKQHAMLSVVAVYAQRPRTWIMRRATWEWCDRAAARWAALEGLPVDRWWAEQLKAYATEVKARGNKHRINIVVLDEEGKRLHDEEGLWDGAMG